MKIRKLLLLMTIIVGLGTFFAFRFGENKEKIQEQYVKITVGEEEYLVDMEELEYESVFGTIINGKGEEKTVEGLGILLRDVLEQENITVNAKAVVTADDSYSAEVSADEVLEDGKVYLLYEEKKMSLIVFGDQNSKRKVSNVVHISVE